MKLSNNSLFIILIFAILKFRLFYISSFQILTPTPEGVQISKDVPVPGDVIVAEGIRVPEDIRLPEKNIRVPEHFRVLDWKKIEITRPDPKKCSPRTPLITAIKNFCNPSTTEHISPALVTPHKKAKIFIPLLTFYSPTHH